MTYRIVYPRQKDLVPLAEMVGASWKATYPNAQHGVSREWVDAYIDSWYGDASVEKWKVAHRTTLRNGKFCYFRIARTDDEQVIGFVEGRKLPLQQELRNLYISKTYYGTGLAQDLINHFLRWTDRNRPIMLDVASYNMRAIAFYKKYDFAIVPGSEKKLYDTIPTITMRRRAEGNKL